MKPHVRTLLSLSALAAISAGLFACGGGSGGNEEITSTKTIATKVEASIVKGATVCVENTNICNQTNDNGIATLKVSKLPVTLVVKIGDIPLGDVTANSNYVPITPLDLADNDNQTAEKIGALIHAIAGDITGSANKIDLTGKKIKFQEQISKPIVELLKQNKQVKLTVVGDNGNHTVSISNETVTFDNEQVNYDLTKLVKHMEQEKILEKFVEFLTKYDGKTVAFNDPEESGNTCVLHVNPANPLQFKFTDCSNPEDNDNTWENLSLDNNGAKAVDEDGVVSYIISVDVKNGKVQYKVEDDNGTWITGWMIVQNASSNSSLLNKFISFLKENNNKTVIFNENSDDNGTTCRLIVNSANPYEFKFVDCSNPDDNDETWEKVSMNGNRVVVTDEDNETAYILDVKDGKVQYKYQDDNGNWITGWMTVQEEAGEEVEENETMIQATKPFFPNLNDVKAFLTQYSGQTVKTSDGGSCDLTYNADQNVFTLNNCLNTDFKEGNYEIYTDNKYPNRVFLRTPDNDNDVFFFEDNSTLCSSDGCIYVGNEPNDIQSVLGDWRKLDVASNSPDLVAKFCIYFDKDGLYYPEEDTRTKLADYSVNGNLITFNATDPDFDVLSMKIFRISEMNGKTYVLTYTKWKNDEGLQIFQKMEYCDNE